MSEERDSRSMSHELLDSDNEGTARTDSKEGSTAAPGKPGRKKNPNSAAARRDQNRIAQREFRLRKQQRIRDLEARVEILSGSKDETFTELRSVVRDLMQENQTLRNLVRSLGSYIGDGLGGFLPSLGFERPQEFVDFINRSETDTAFEGFQRRKKASQAAAATNAASGMSINLNKKRTLDGHESANKRTKPGDLINGSGSSKSSPESASTRFPSLMVPIGSAGANAHYYSVVGRSSQDAGLFSELLHGQGGPSVSSAMYMTGPAPEGPSYATSPSLSAGTQFPTAFHPPINVASTLSSQPFLPNPPMSSGSSAPPGTSSSTSASHAESSEQDDALDDPKLQEATKLIRYHLDNYKRNNAYCLPQSLRPTLVQRTVPHESVIDGIPHPELRDRLILLRGRFDLVDALHECLRSLTLHGDDVLAHTNWEIGESWLRRYGFLVDQPVLNICNRWRLERGEPELLLSDIAHPLQPDLTTTAT